METELKATLTRIERQSQKDTGVSWKDAAKRLNAIAVAVGEVVTAERVDLYLQALSKDFSPSQVCTALEKLFDQARWFPKIPEIRELIEGKPEDVVDAKAEAAWGRVLEYVDKWHPDVGRMSDNKVRLTERDHVALRACGGVYNLWAEQDGGPGLPFMHRDFIRTWKLSSRVDGIPLLSDGQESKSLGVSGFHSVAEMVPGIVGRLTGGTE